MGREHEVRGVGDVLRSLALGVAGTLLAAEIGFRLLGPLFSVEKDASAGEIRVLCEGDSFTYGIGGRSFPEQIEAVLAERTGRTDVRTINEGIPGLTSAMVADRLEEHIVESRPDYVVVVIGENNSWNSLPSNLGAGTWWHATERVLLHSRVYKFFKVATIGWTSNTFHEAAAVGDGSHPAMEVPESPENIGLLFQGEQSPNVRSRPVASDEEFAKFMAIIELQERGQYDQAVADAEAFIARNPDAAGGYVLVVSALLRLGRYAEGAERAKAGLATTRDPFHEELAFQLGNAYRRNGQIDLAKQAWVEGLRAWPTSKAIYWCLARQFYDEQRTFDVLTAVGDIPGIGENPMHQHLLRISEATGGSDPKVEVSRAFEADITRMIDIAKAHDVPILFSSYPDAMYGEVATAAQKGGVPFLDLRPLYQARFSRREDYISPDRCHCNTAGYRVMAEAFADEIQRALPALASTR